MCLCGNVGEEPDCDVEQEDGCDEKNGKRRMIRRKRAVAATRAAVVLWRCEVHFLVQVRTSWADRYMDSLYIFITHELLKRMILLYDCVGVVCWLERATMVSRTQPTTRLSPSATVCLRIFISHVIKKGIRRKREPLRSLS